MNKLLISVFALAFPFAAMAQSSGLITACNPANNPANVALVSGTGFGPALFIRNSFEVKCSANVNLRFQQSAVGVGVGSNSIKGKKSFAGSSLGGAVGAGPDCTGVCTAAMADAALAALPGIGSL